MNNQGTKQQSRTTLFLRCFVVQLRFSGLSQRKKPPGAGWSEMFQSRGKGISAADFYG